MILLSILCVIRHLICGNNLNWLLNLNLIYETWWTGVRKGLLISILGKLSWFHLTSLITLVLLMWKWMGLFLKKKHLLRCWDWTWINLDWGSYIISIAKTSSMKIGALICSMKFLSLEVALYLYKSTTRPCMKYHYHVWAGAPSCYLELLGKLVQLVPLLLFSRGRSTRSAFLDITRMSLSTVSFLTQLDWCIIM